MGILFLFVDIEEHESSNYDTVYHGHWNNAFQIVYQEAKNECWYHVSWTPILKYIVYIMNKQRSKSKEDKCYSDLEWQKLTILTCSIWVDFNFYQVDCE